MLSVDCILVKDCVSLVSSILKILTRLFNNAQRLDLASCGCLGNESYKDLFPNNLHLGAGERQRTDLKTFYKCLSKGNGSKEKTMSR